MTPLHWAVKVGQLDIVRAILEQRCDIDALDILGRNALYISVEEGHLVIARLLLLRGATPWSVCLSMTNILEKYPVIKALIKECRKVTILILNLS